jgi:pyrroline-5-carboxylate reductase
MTLTIPGPLLLVGAGKMGGALLKGWLGEGLDPALIFAQEPNPSAEAAKLLKRHGIATGSPPKLPRAPAVVLLAVKPQAMDEVLAEIAPLVGKDSVVLSIAAGRTLKSLAKPLHKGAAIVRAMPNTPAEAGAGISMACANAAVTAKQRRLCDALLGAVGEVMWIDDETLMDAVTAVSGSGPAYVFLLAECLAEAGVAAGLDHALATKLARETVIGAAELLRRSDLSPTELRANVTSPKGTTEAALAVLSGKHGFQELLVRAVAAAKKRSQELSS